MNKKGDIEKPLPNVQTHKYTESIVNIEKANNVHLHGQKPTKKSGWFWKPFIVAVAGGITISLLSLLLTTLFPQTNEKPQDMASPPSTSNAVSEPHSTSSSIPVDLTLIDDFQDKDQIIHQEAVAAICGLNIMTEKGDGIFDPSCFVTRGEMARLGCLLMNGGKELQLGEPDESPYPDTEYHWANSAIAYCAKLGIVTGDEHGNYNPNDFATFSDIARMLLVCLGYQPDVERFEGPSWQVNVDAVADLNKLYDHFEEVNTTMAITRDDVAQIMYNALQTNTIAYHIVEFDGNTLTQPINTGETLYEDRFH